MAGTAKPEPGSRVSSLAWCQPLRSVDREVAGRNASERIDSPDPQGSAAKSNVIEVADPIPLRGTGRLDIRVKTGHKGSKKLGVQKGCRRIVKKCLFSQELATYLLASEKEDIVGQRRVCAKLRQGNRTALYLRVSTADQKPDLQDDGLR